MREKKAKALSISSQSKVIITKHITVKVGETQAEIAKNLIY